MAITAAEAVDLLRRAHANSRLAHAYLITGPEGSGKRKLAADLSALLVNGEAEAAMAHTDVHVVEPESKSRRIVVDQIRELERELQMRSARGGRKVGVIIDADRLQLQASNAFLKTLEEPPAQSHLVLVTALPDQLLETILSRCIEIPLRATSRQKVTPRQESLLATLQQTMQRENLELPHIFGLVREFQRLLTEAKQAAQAIAEEAMEKEEKQYKQIADAKWFEEREEYFKALSEARYVAERTRLLDTLEQWWADVLRQQAISAAGDSEMDPAVQHVVLDFPGHARESALLASRYSTADALERAAALEKLRDQLRNPGVQESLAIEISFLRAFCAPVLS